MEWGTTGSVGRQDLPRGPWAQKMGPAVPWGVPVAVMGVAWKDGAWTSWIEKELLGRCRMSPKGMSVWDRKKGRKSLGRRGGVRLEPQR